MVFFNRKYFLGVMNIEFRFDQRNYKHRKFVLNNWRCYLSDFTLLFMNREGVEINLHIWIIVIFIPFIKLYFRPIHLEKKQLRCIVMNIIVTYARQIYHESLPICSNVNDVLNAYRYAD